MDFNQAPYFDDFDEFKKYYKVLFRPGVAVQTREMNQLQSILQNQITKFGDHVFKEGSMVIPGQVNYNDKLHYVKLASKSLGSNALTYLENKEISTGVLGTGVKAVVVKAVASEGTDPDTLIVLYTGSEEGVDVTSAKEFSGGQTLYLVEENAISVTLQPGTAATGRSICASIQDGIYYLNGYFVNVSEQVVVIEKYVTDISLVNAKAGIQYTESIVTEETDASLYDNANNTTNYTAPGAHRYKIDVEFVRTDLDETPDKFFELVRVENGTLQLLINGSQYNVLEETLARRTYDESGNYVVDNFKLDIKEHRSNNRGSWNSQTNYLVNDFILVDGKYFNCVRAGQSGLVQPAAFATADETAKVTDGTAYWRYTTQVISNRGQYTPEAGGNSSNLVLNLGVGKAYVQGFEIQKTQGTNITIGKSRDSSVTVNRSMPVPVGNYILLDSAATWGLPDVASGPQIKLFDRQIGDTSYALKFGYGNEVGTARVKFIDNDASGGIKLGLFDVKMQPGKKLDRDVNSVAIVDTSATVTSKAYKISGTFRYSGTGVTSIALTGATFGMSAAANSSATISVTGVSTTWTRELNEDDIIYYNSGSYVSSYVVVSVTNNTTMTLRYTGIGASAAVPATSNMTSMTLSLPANVVYGIGTSSALIFELRQGDRMFLSSASVYVSGTVTRIITHESSGDDRNRIHISSVTTAAQAVSGVGLDAYAYYEGYPASFTGNVLGSYAAGVNAFKLTGTFALKDVDGTNTIDPTPHQAVRIVAQSTDAKLLTESLYVNDLIEVNGNRIFVTRRSNNTNVYGVCLDKTIQTESTYYPAFLLSNKVYDTNYSSAMYKVDDATSLISNNQYQVYKTQTVYLPSATSVVSVAVSTATSPYSESVVSTDSADYLIAAVDITSGTTKLSVDTITPTVGAINITLNTSVTGTVRVIYPIQREAATDTLGGVKTKTLTYDQDYEVLDSSTALVGSITLPHADVYRINKILMSTAGFVTSWSLSVATNAVDVTNNYELDDGQRDGYYDFAKLNLAAGFPAPSGSLKIYYDYFNHGDGDFFAYSSYNADQVPFENIPEYKGKKLRDYIDFRPLFGTTSTLTNINVPVYGTTFVADTGRYLARKDKLLLDRNRTFYVVSSQPAVKPADVKIAFNNNSVELYDIALEAYTDSSEWPDVSFELKDNKRYTMKDIGKLEKRIGNLEEIASLNLLEVATKSLQIRDNNDKTLERYKTGFYVDNFSDQTNADPVLDNRFSINTAAKTMQTHISTYSLPLVEKLNYSIYSPVGNAGGQELTPINAARENQNYAVTGDYLTLPYTTSVVLKQTLATTSISVAPFLVATFLGKMKVYPTKDIYENIKTIKITKQNTVNAERLKQAVALAQRLYGSQYIIDTYSSTKLVETEVDKDLIPFCRPNTLTVKVTGLKPNTKLYTFIDDLDVRPYVTGAVKFTMNSVDKLDFNNSRPNSSKEWARWRSLSYTETVKKKKKNVRVTYNPKTYDVQLPSKKYGDAFRKAFEPGAVVYYRESGGWLGSGVAMHQVGSTLYMVNGRGRLSPRYLRARANSTYNYSGNFYIASTGAHTSKLPTTIRTAAQVCTDDADGNLYSDGQGTVVFTIDFPENDSLSFLTGKKKIEITDDPTNHPDNWTTKADAFYEVEGYNVTITKTYVTTKSYGVRPIPHDPIAQSFKLPEEFNNGAFITGVSVYFQQAPELEDKTVSFEIRTCDSTGRPSEEIVPGTQVVKIPSEVATDSSTGQIATTFELDRPIHLMANKNYALVLKSDTKNYRVWIATLGQQDVMDKTKTYSKQALLGSFFKSQDGTLWSEDQLSDIKFELHRAKFKTANTGVAWMVNQNLPNKGLPPNPLTFMHGSAKILVAHPNHGFRNGDLVRLHSKSYAELYTVSSGTTIAGVPVTEIFGTNIAEEQEQDSDSYLTVESANLDSYVVTVTTTANLGDTATTAETLRVEGGSDIFAHDQVLYHVMTPQISIINFDNTSIDLMGYMVEGHTYDSLPITGYTRYSNGLDLNVPNVENSRPKVILTDLNESLRYSGTAITAGTSTETWRDSFVGRFYLRSSSNHVSPVIDLSSAYLNVIQHRIDNPSRSSRLGGSTLPPYGSTSVFISYKTIVSAVTTVAFNAADSSIVTSVNGAFNSVVPGRYITVSGAANAQNNNTSTGILVTNVNLEGTKIFVNKTLAQEAGGQAITIRQVEDFTEEMTRTDASGESKYITRKVNLENPATGLKILVDVNIPSAVDVDVYYKIGSSAQDFDGLVWDKFENMPVINKTNNRANFTELEVNISDFDAGGAPVDLPEFTAFQIKFVMRSTNGARIPAFRNLRVIAHA